MKSRHLNNSDHLFVGLESSFWNPQRFFHPSRSRLINFFSNQDIFFASEL